MNLEGKRVAILGGTRVSCQIVEAARALGMHTTVIDYNSPEKSPAKLIADEHALISVADVDGVACYLREHAINGVTVGYADVILGWYADICEAAGLPCYGTRRLFELYTDKRAWKAECERFGVPVGRTYGAGVLDLPENAVCYPVFVKPSDGSGARGAQVARNPRELRCAWDKARTFSKSGDVLVEDYLEGPELTVFWVFMGGEYHVALVGNRHVKHNQEGVIPLPAGYTFPASVLPRYLEEVAPRVRRMLASQGVRDGMMFMQCVVRDGLPYVYDIGYRLTGSLEHHMTAAVAGYSVIDMMLHHAVTGQMTDDAADVAARIRRGLYAPCYNISCLMRPGTIGRFEGLEMLAANPSVLACVRAHIEGEILPPEAKGQLRQIALRVLGKVNSVDELASTMLQLQDTVRIVSPEGEDLMLPGLEPSDFEGVLLR